jgi:hypothetical protein
VARVHLNKKIKKIKLFFLKKKKRRKKKKKAKVAATPKEVGSSPATTRQRDWGVAANLFLLFLFYF